MNKQETRILEAPEWEVRTDEETQQQKWSGYAALFGELSQDLGGFRERIRPGAFTRSISEGKIDVIANVDHSTDVSDLLGRSSDGTLRLSPNQKGLRVEIDPPDTQRARDVATLLERGQLKMSFAFTTVEDDWSDLEGVMMRELIDVDLYDVAICVRPAYEQTSIAQRSLDNWRKTQIVVPDLSGIKRRLRLAGENLSISA